MELLLSILGIGEDIAAVILSEFVDINYFKSLSKLSKWTGHAFESTNRDTRNL